MMQHLLKKTAVMLLAGLTLTLGLPGPWPSSSAVAAESAPTGKPKIWLSPEIEIEPAPQPKVINTASTDEKAEKPGWFSRNQWWVLLGAVAAGAAAALAAGGDSGDSSGGGDAGGTGTFTTGW